VEATKVGFAHFVREPVEVTVNTAVRIDITMQVGAVTQTVEVTGATPLLTPETSSLGQVVETRMTNDLPLNGRNPVALMELVPGVVPQGSNNTASGVFGLNPVQLNPYANGNIQINGGTAGQSAAYWDGAPENANGNINQLAIYPIQDSVLEFKVMTDNLPAQYDRFAGGIMNFTTKNGTNVFHGEAYEFVRNKVFNANTFFNNRGGSKVPAWTQNQFGGNLGGAIKKDKLFFFGAYDAFRLRNASSFTFSAPTVLQRGGNFTDWENSSGQLIPIYDPLTVCGEYGNPACAVDSNGEPIYNRQQFSYNGVLNVIPPNRIDPVAKVLTNMWGLPTSAGLPYTNANNFNHNAAGGGNMQEFITRVDDTVSSKQRVFGRYTVEQHHRINVNDWGQPPPYQVGVYEDYLNQQAAFDDTYMWSPTFVSDIELSYLRQGYGRHSGGQGFPISQFGSAWVSYVSTAHLPDTNIAACLSQLESFCDNQMAIGSTITNNSDDWGIFPHIIWVKGRNTWQFGGDFRLSRYAYYQDEDPTGLYNFGTDYTTQNPLTNVGGAAMATFLLGYSDGGQLPVAAPTMSQSIYRAFYVQDKIQATHKLTFNLGFRVNWDGAFSERHNRESLFLANATNPLAAATGLPLKGELVLADSPQFAKRTGMNPSEPTYAPRAGFAYALNSKTVFRGGYGIFWLPMSVNFSSIQEFDTVNNYNNPVVSSLNGGITPFTQLATAWAAGITPAPQRTIPIPDTVVEGGSFGANVPFLPSAYAQQWNIDLQRELPGGIFVDVAYAGSKGTHLVDEGAHNDDLNPVYLSQGSALLNPVINPFAGLMPKNNPTLNGATVPAKQLLLPYPQYTNQTIDSMSGFDSEYNALQMKVQKKFRSGQTILMAYTNEKWMNDGGDSVTTWLDHGPAPTQNWYNLHGERSLSAYDMAQRLVVSYVLDLPWGPGRKFLTNVHGPVGKLISGWSGEGITTLDSGSPLVMGTQSNLTYSGGGSRPNYVPSATGCAQNARLSGSAESRLTEWYNVSCFAQPPAFTYGNVGRVMGDLRSDSLTQFDFAAVKKTSWGSNERWGIQFRAEFFNLFNTPQFYLPNTTIGNPSAGVVSTQSNYPRLIQFGLKLMF
jgi:hypothetical protein